MLKRILIGMVAVSLVVIALAFIARPKPCSGNFLQNDLLACNTIGDQK